MSKPPEIPKPRFQAAPQTIGGDEKRKPLPRKSGASTRCGGPTRPESPAWLQEMADRARATKPERDKARAERARERHHLARWPKGRDG